MTEGVDDNDDAKCDDQDCISHPAANDKIACNTELQIYPLIGFIVKDSENLFQRKL